MSPTDDDLTLSEVIEPMPELSRVLESGTRGRDVARLQLDLKRSGFNPGEIDGIFGTKTEAAVNRFREREGLSADSPAGSREVWDKVMEVAARERVEDLSRAAGELEQRAAEYRTQAKELEEQAKTAREGGDRGEAGARMEEAGETWIEGASAWELAADLWIEAAHVGEPYAIEDGWKAYARWGRATDAARMFAGRARSGLRTAGEDLDAAGSTDHADRIAAALSEARARAAH